LSAACAGEFDSLDWYNQLKTSYLGPAAVKLPSKFENLPSFTNISGLSPEPYASNYDICMDECDLKTEKDCERKCGGEVFANALTFFRRFCGSFAFKSRFPLLRWSKLL